MSASAAPPHRRPARRAGRLLAGRNLTVALLLALVFGPLLVAAPAPAPAQAQTPAAVQCVRRHVPDPTTLSAITAAYPRQVQSLSPADFGSVPAGVDVPESAQAPTDFQQALRAIYGQPATPCTQAGVKTGDLIAASNGPEIDVVAPAVACVRRHVPDPPTLDAMLAQAPRPAPQITASQWESVPGWVAVPESAQDPTGFAQFMQQAYGPPPVACVQLAFNTGDVIWSPGNVEADVLVAAPPAVACARRWVTDPPTLNAMTGLYPRTAVTLSAADWESLPAGANVPEPAQDPTGFAQFMQQAYGPPPAPCTQAGVNTGDVIWSPGNVQADVVVAAPPVGPTPTAQPTPPAQSVTVAFGPTGGSQSWTAPAGVTRATFAVFGAQGGGAVPGRTVPGGNGAGAIAALAVTPGAVYQINVGGQGVSGEYSDASSPGFNGGGAGGNAVGAGGGQGGGASDVRAGGFSLSDRLLVAGGGGGAGWRNDVANYGVSCPGKGADSNGGPGGLSGVDGHSANGVGGLGGGGASPSGPGLGGTVPPGDSNGPGQVGSAGSGGAGGSAVGLSTTCVGGGGGGGYYGGGGGAAGPDNPDQSGNYLGGGGGGGSSYGPAGTVFQTGVQAGDGLVLVTYAGSPVLPTPSPTPTQVPTLTPQATLTPVAPPATATATATATGTATATATASATPSPTATATAVPPTTTATFTATPSPTATATPTPEATLTATATATASPTATATASPTATPTATATPSGGVPVTAEVVDCQPQGGSGDEYACTLRVTFGGALEINTVWRVALAGAALPTTGDAPQVTGYSGCAYQPNPSPYYPGGYYDVNISTDGCAAGAVITLTEAVTGTAGASTTHSVAGLSGTAMGTAQAPYTLPAGTAGTPTPSPTPIRTSTATLTPTPPAGPTATHTPAAAGPTATHTATPVPPIATPPPATATPSPTATPPRASDGQHLGLQPAEVQAAFQATHGDGAAQRWADEHEAALNRPVP